MTWTVSPTQGTCSGSTTCALGTIIARGSDTSPRTPADSATIGLTAATDKTTCAANVITNSASVSTSNAGTDATPTTAAHIATITVNFASIHITKVADTPSVNAGDPIHYTITVNNTDTGDTRDDTVNDTLPTNPGLAWTVSPSQGTCSGSTTCALGTIAAGGSATITLSSP